MPHKQPKTIFLKDYTPPPQRVTHVDMDVYVDATQTVVKTTLRVVVNHPDEPFILNGEGLALKSVMIDGEPINDYVYMDDLLTVNSVPATAFEISIEQICNPAANTALSGLYLSNNMFCTQMEAEGFRRFAFMQDRPDVMATYSVRLEAPMALPVLLSNGNPGEKGEVVNTDRHYAVWHDPHPKPTYLFALVAGNLAHVQDTFETSEGRHVALGIYVEKGKEDRCAWAMECLKASMRWDEERFNRVYDLDVFNIVAVSDFNMGAMENKGLNIFNDKYILARPDTATDLDHIQIERIIAHEYFHNWTGNRITCRDWFQLCLKEGLTVFRDQEFSSDLRSRAVKRIESVKTLRARQFPEDQGPLAHPVRPSNYIEINNFYTPTVYEKGAEICRMLLTLLGRDAFRKAMDVYFARHDGEAATVEDFLRCMTDVSGRDLSHFALWYEQAGTPVVDVKTNYDAVANELVVTISQKTPQTPGQPVKQPLHLPLKVGLIDERGSELPLELSANAPLENGIVEMTSSELTLRFRSLLSRPVLSLNRGFSAPVILRTDATESDLLIQMAHDSDPFNRWEAAQTVARRLFVAAYHGNDTNIAQFADGLAETLASNKLDSEYKSLILQMPGEAEIAATLAQDVDASLLHDTRQNTVRRIAKRLQPLLQSTLEKTHDGRTYRPDPEGTGRRSLHLSALSLLAAVAPDIAITHATSLFETADNMTLESGALSAILSVNNDAVDGLLDRFYSRHAEDHLLVDKWFAQMAARPAAAAAQRIDALSKHAAFNFKTPNKVYALFGGFTGGNPSGFHAADGTGYALLADCIIKLNDINPQVAARMATGFRSWKLFDSKRRRHALAQMQRILGNGGISKDVFEIISRTST